ncbi:hypothetical protein VNI00_007811 [Paramarasmius palmivorus]|uniref:Uncharacterized protein n=1 Tax=Paramarasmius palmivorus TaxID=297713 RepID=A0AAW0CZC4_9AGAR
MAALYLHNAIFIPEPSEASSSRPRPHSRTYSTGTLRTLTTDLSHPTEPLLPSDINTATSGSIAYQDLLNRQPSYPDGTQSDWDMSLSLDGDPASAREKRGHWEESVRRRLRIWRGVKVLFEVVLGAWAIYNTVRYFIAYTIYSSREGEAVSLALGTSTAVGFAFFLCEAALAGFQSRLIAVHVPLRSLLISRTILLYIACFFLCAPSVVNLVVTIIWRHSHSTELDTDSRCQLDIDIIWSINPSKSICAYDNWTAWLALAIFRVAFTLVLSASLLITTSQYNLTRRPSHYTSYRRRHHRPRQGNGSQPEVSTLSTTATSRPSPSASRAPSHSLRHPSHSTVASHATLRQNTSTDRRSVRTSQASSTLDPPLSATSHQSSSQHTCEDNPSPPASVDHFNPTLVQQRLTDAIYHSPTPSYDNSASMRDDHELNNFVDRFRMLVSQIARETEEAIEYARPDTYVTEVNSDSDSDSDSDSRRSPEFFNADYPLGYPPHMIPPTLGYDEFGRPYPPEDHVRILNSYIRRMPTIESLGSREVASSTNSYRDHERLGSLSIHTLSRPPTRTMTLTDFTGSEPPSRANSLSLNMAALAGSGTNGSNGVFQPPTPGGNSTSHQSISETGEWAGDRDRTDQDSPVELSDAGRSGSQRSQRSSRPSISRSTFSYYTAASGVVPAGNGNTSSPAQTPSSGGFASLPDDTNPRTS